MYKKVIKKLEPNLASQLEGVALGVRLGELMWHEVRGYEWGLAEFLERFCTWLYFSLFPKYMQGNVYVNFLQLSVACIFVKV